MASVVVHDFDVLRIHAQRRGIALAAPELGELARASAGFAGAEIEQAIVAALYTAHGQRRPVDARMLQAELGATRPLAVVMAERVAALRHWAGGRTVPA